MNITDDIYGILPNDWNLFTIGEMVNDGLAHLQTGPFGTNLQASAYKLSGTPVIAVKNIGVNKVLLDDAIPRIDDQTVKRLSQYQLLENDIVFGRKGAVDRRALISKEEEGWLQGSDCIRLRFLSPSVDAKYISYILGTPQYLKWITRNAEGSTMPSLNQQIIKRIPIPLPPISEQRVIADILGSLDDKIELNRLMNETLEEIARTIFKSWFVDFDPVHAKSRGEQPLGMDAATAVLFPDHFEDSELGPIPAGWRAGTVGDGFQITMGQSPPGDTYNGLGEGLPFYQGRRDFGSRYPELRVYCTQPTRIAQSGDTLVSVRAPVGDVNMALQECCIGRGVAAVRHNSDSRSFTFYSMLSLSEEFKNYDGEGTVFGSISGKDFQKIKVVLPATEMVNFFESFVKTMDEQIEINVQESRLLAQTRDVLLPKLVSGEVRIEQIENYQKDIA